MTHQTLPDLWTEDNADYERWLHESQRVEEKGAPETGYLSDAFKARQMPNRKIRRAKEAADLSDLPLFNQPQRTHEESQRQAQQPLQGK